MSVHLSPIGNGFQFFTVGGLPLNAGTVSTYAAGTSTPLATYTDASGGTPNANPIVLGVDGRPPAEVWLTDGLAYKFVLADFLGNVIRTYDNLSTAADLSLLAANTPPTGASLVGWRQLGSGTVARTVQTKLQDVVSALDWGMVGDGATDNRAALANAVAVIKGTGTALHIPAGQFVINSDNGSITLEECALLGESVLEGVTPAVDRGTVLRITGVTNAPFLVRRGVEVRGLGIYYPNQTDSATPTAYPPTFDFDFSNGPVQFVYFDNCVAYNAYRFCRMNDPVGGVGHVWFTNNSIYGIHRCFEIQRNLEVIHFVSNDFTFGIWNAATEGGSRAYTRANGIIVDYGWGDGIFFRGNLCFGYLRALSMGSGNQLVQLCRFSSNTFDQCRYAYYCTGAGNFYGMQSDGNDYFSLNDIDHTKQGVSLYMDNTGASLDTWDLDGDAFLEATEDAIFITGNTPVRTINVTGGSFRNFGVFKAAGSYSAFNVSGSFTTLQVTGAYIRGAGNAFTNGVSGTLNVLKLTGNTFEGCNAVLNAISANTLHHTGNTSFATFGATSDVISAVVNNWNVGNRYDKASGATTRPAFSVKKTSSQTFGAGPTDVAFAGGNFDRGTNFATPNFTTPAAGRYRFSWTLEHDNTGTPGDKFVFSLAASTGQQANKTYIMVGDTQSVSGETIFELAAAATVKLSVTRASGAGSFVTVNDGNFNYFTGALVE